MTVSHAGLIAAAYAIAAVAILGAVAAILLDHRAQRRALERLEATRRRREGA